MKKLYEITIYTKHTTVVSASDPREAYELCQELSQYDWDTDIQEVDIEETYEDESRDDA
jgi:hypothetical protein